MRAVRGRRISKAAGDRLFALALLAPGFAITVIFILIPLFDSIYRSLLDYKVSNIIAGRPGVWNHFANYVRLFSSGKLPVAMTNTLSFVLGVVLAQFVIGLSLALILHTGVSGSRLIRSLMMIPWVVPTVISGLIWMWIYQPQYGLLRYLLGVVSGGAVADFAILNNPVTAMLGVAVAALWKQVPLGCLLLLAGLTNVPDDIIEAAKIDGASSWRRLIHVVLPSMRSVIMVTVSMSIIENFKQFPLFWTMTGGGPNNATTTMAILSYREAFVSNDFGSGAAATTVWMGMMVLVVFVYRRIFREE